MFLRTRGLGEELGNPPPGWTWGKGNWPWAPLRAHQLLTSPLFFPGFLLQALTFLPLLTELRLL
jgi:hypothetical protein